LCEGRLDVGVGLGAAQKLYPAFGMTSARRAARFAEGLTLLIKLWTEARVTFDGEFYKLDDVAMEPKPVQKPHPPLWFGAHHPDALKRAVELGHGFMGAGSSPTAVFRDEVAVLRKLLEGARRDPATFPISKRVYIAVDRDKARAGQRLTAWFGAYYRRAEMAEQVSVWGSVDDCAEGLRAVIDAGAQSLMLNPVFDFMEQAEQIATEVAPRL
jgi:alkanesulfonate monooxygenase SsuD/methylene tetrahydromethanopterin reductase-like flavin-dependent oxidoreductase (luciferase family)